MPAYDSVRFEPPAPLARVTLRGVGSGSAPAEVPLLLDWGADVTLVPREAVEAVGAQLLPGKRYELLGFKGSRSVASAVDLEMDFANRTFRGRFLVVDQEWGILGRNVLNHLTILCDGPRLDWEVQPGAA
jgi:hypothetical protein